VGLAGRDAERRRIDGWLDAVPDRSGVMSLVGEAGIGKTALWREAIATAETRGMRVLVAQPAEGETMLGYSSVADLLEKAVDHVAALPEPQRDAIDAAMMRSRPRHPLSTHAVAIGTAELLRRLADEGPLLVAVDDLQWLDGSSAEVLAFVIRRLPTRNVGVAVTVRSSGGGLPLGLDRIDPHERIDVGPLSLGALHHLLRDHLGHVFGRPTLVRLSEASRGNPLFAIELGRALLRSGVEIGPGRPLPVPESLRDLIAGRLDTVSPAARRVLLAVAAAPTPPLDVVEAMLDLEALAEAEEANLVEVRNGRVVSAHPLIAEACYESATTADRRTTHAALAGLARGVEEQARHLALSGPAGDPRVATTLHDAATQAAERGANDSAVELARLTVEHTATGEDARWPRLLLLGDLLFRTGDSGAAVTALEEVRAGAADRVTRARALRLLAHVAWETDTPEAGAALTEEALALLGPDDPAEERAALHTTMAGLLITDLEAAAAHSAEALALLSATADPDPGVLAAALTQAAANDFLVGRGLDAARYERAIELEAQTVSPRLAESALACRAADRKYADHIDDARADMLELLRRAEAEDESSVPYALSHLPQLELWAGNWDEAEAWARRHLDLAERTGQTAQLRQANFNLALVASYRGDGSAARALAEDLMVAALAAGDAWSEASACVLIGFVCSSEGDSAGAAAQLGRWNEIYLAMGLVEPGRRRLMAEYLEALVAVGELERARVELDAFAELSRKLDRPSGLGQAARAAAVLHAAEGRLDEAVAAVAEGLEAYGRVDLPYDRARLRLVEGGIQRRVRQKRAARAALADARSTFERLGAKRLADRAAAELDRLEPGAAAGVALTPTERRIAGLLAEGRTVKAVAELAFMSPKTVEAHLTRVYRKLGINSRAELGARLAAATEEM
jgi:DNA-binding CsgD family transcriptional regulator